MERRWVLSAILFLIAFGFYLHGAYPTVSVGDSGEFITAGATLGIPHAPGYPSYVVLAKCFEQAIPWANAGYRINLFSSFCGAVTVVLLFVLTWQLTVSLPISLFAAILFLVSEAHRVNAQASEVFALHAAFCAAVLLGAFHRRWLLAAFFTGLGLGNHQTLVLLGPALFVLYRTRPLEERPPLKLLIISLMGGLSIHAFLLFRAGQTPLLNGGNPDTLDRLWRVLTRADYGSMTLALGETPPRDFASSGLQLARFFRGLASQISWAGMLIAIAGIGMGWRKQSSPVFTLSLAVLFLGPLFFLLGNLPFDAQSNGLLERFYIAPALFSVVLAAIGVAYLTQRYRGLAWFAWLIPVFLLWSSVRMSEAAPFRTDFRAYAYGRNNLHSLPPNARFIMDGGDDTFYTLAYLTLVEKRRPDIEYHDRGGVVFPGLYGNDFRSLNRADKETRRQQIEHSLASGTHPLYYSTMNEGILPGIKLIQEGILYKVGETQNNNLWELYDLRGVAPWSAGHNGVPKDYRTRALLPFYAYQRSVQAARESKGDDALRFASIAFALGSDVLWLVPNLIHNAFAWAEQNYQAGHLDPAAQWFHQIIAWDPRSSMAWSNLGAIEERKQNLPAAVTDYQQAIAIEPGSETAHFNMAVAYWKMNDWPQVIAELKRVLEINPANQAAKNYLFQAQMRMGHQ